MYKIAEFIVNKRKLIVLLTVILLIFSVIKIDDINLEPSLEAYLQEDSQTKKGIELMAEKFVTYSSVNVMVENISYEDAEGLVDELEKLDGVDSVSFDDSTSHYNNVSALFTVNLIYQDGDPECKPCVDSIEDLLAKYDIYIETTAYDQGRELLEKEVVSVLIVAALIIAVVLLFTSKTYMEVPIIMLTFLVAIIINMGTNFIFGTISYVSNTITSVLQLALSIDYAIMLMNRFKEERKSHENEEAAVIALAKSIPEIGASCLTTIGGLVAMMFMTFRLGYDMAICLVKAIFIALITVFTFMPAMMVMFAGSINKTEHKSFLPDTSFIGKWAYKTRRIIPVFVIVIVSIAAIFSQKCPYIYTYTPLNFPHMSQVLMDKQKIIRNFPGNEKVVLLLPETDHEKEKQLLDELSEYEEVNYCTGLANTEAMDGYTLTDELTPRQFSELTDIDYELSKLIFTMYNASNADGDNLIEVLGSNKIPLMDIIGYVAEICDTGVVNLDEETADMLKNASTQIERGRKQLEADDCSRIIVTLNIEQGDVDSYPFLDTISETADKYYDDEVLLIGALCTEYDFKKSFEVDNWLVSLLSIFFVLVVLLFTFKSIALPIILILIIQGSIWINFSFPFFTGKPVVFMWYLVASAIQMGANIDYAIVMSSRFMEVKGKMPMSKAITDTVNFAFPTVITSGTILMVAGYLLMFMTTEPSIIGMGEFIGRGTLITMFLVLFNLPQLLIAGSKIIDKTSFAVKKAGKTAAAVIIGILAVGSSFVFTQDAYAENAYNTIHVSTVQDIERLAKNCSLDTYSENLAVYIDNDISLDGSEFEGIPYFAGKMYGQGHEITDFMMDGSRSSVGFIYETSESGYIYDLTVRGDLSMNSKSQEIGGIVGINRGHIKRCNYVGMIEAAEIAGGIAGINEESGVIEFCTSDGKVNALKMTGGICGLNYGSINNCSNLAYINIDNADTRVNIDNINFTTVDDIFSLASLETLNVTEDSGGIAGYSTGDIYKCDNTATIGYQHFGYNVGGIAGRNSGYISNCQNSGNIYGRKDVGGIVGQAEPFVLAVEQPSLAAGPRDSLEDFLSAGDVLGGDIDDASYTLNSEIRGISGEISKLNSIINDVSAIANDAMVNAVDDVDKFRDRVNRLSDKADKITKDTNNLSDNTAKGVASMKNAINEINAIREIIGRDPLDIISHIAEIRTHFANARNYAQKGIEYLGGTSKYINKLFEDSNGMISVVMDLGKFDTKLDVSDLYSNLNEMNSIIGNVIDKSGRLSDEIDNSSRILGNDIDSISDKSSELLDAIDAAIDEGIERLGEPIIKDTSDADINSVHAGKIEKSVNYGDVEADVNVGGIAGTMAIDSTADPEDDYSDENILKNKYEYKIVLFDNKNNSNVKSKKDCVGSICGRQSLGTVYGCEGYGKISSSNGSYVGGISGLSESVVRNSFSKCFLKGNKYVGGVIGAGSEDILVDNLSTVSNCISMVQIDGESSYKGAISGSRNGNFTENYFVSDTLSGLDTYSYAGKAEPVSYRTLINNYALPAEFYQFELKFIADGRVIKQQSFNYGDSFDKDIIPLIPKKDGLSSYWDYTSLENLKFDTDINAVYEKYHTSLASEVRRNDGRNTFFTEGYFGRDDQLTAIQQERSEKEGKNTYAEDWIIKVPFQSGHTHMIRFLPAYGENQNVKVYIHDGEELKELDYENAGSYIRFEIPSDDAWLTITSKQREEKPEIFIIAVIIVLIALAAFILFRIITNRNNKTESDYELNDESVLPQNDDSNNENSVNVRKSIKRKKRRIIITWILIGTGAVIIIVAAYMFSFQKKLLNAGVDILTVVNDYARSEAYNTSISTSLTDGENEYALNFDISKYKIGNENIYELNILGVPLYICGDKMYLSDGKGIDTDILFSGNPMVVERFINLVRHGEVSSITEDGRKHYTFEENDGEFGQFLSEILERAVDIKAEISYANIEFVVYSGKLTDIIINASGTNTANGNSIDLRVNAGVNEAPYYDIVIPDAVLNAVETNKYEALGIDSETLEQVLKSFVRLIGSKGVDADLYINASCGPVSLKRNEKVRFTFSDDEGSENVSAETAKKIIKAIYKYFSDSTMTVNRLKSGNKEIVAEMSPSQMKDILDTVLPKAVNMNAVMDKGTVSVVLKNGRIDSVSLKVNGVVDVVGTETAASIDFMCSDIRGY